MVTFGATRVDVVVLGAGIVGCATAYHLAKRGLSVCVLERDAIGSQQSGRAWGFIRQQGRHSAEMPLAAEASVVWGGLEAELGADLEYIRSGIVVTAETSQDVERMEKARVAAVAIGVRCDTVGRRELQRLVPGVDRWSFGLYAPDDGHAEPFKATMAFAAAARSLGAVFHEGVDARSISVSGNRVVGVVSSHAEFESQRIVCALGVGTPRLLRGLGIRIPIQPVRAPVAQTDSSPYPARVPVWSPHVAFRPRRDGSFYVANGYREIDAEYDLALNSLRDITLFVRTLLRNRGTIRVRFGTESLRTIRRQIAARSLEPTLADPLVSQSIMRRNVRHFRDVFPSLANVGIARVWAGRIDATPDLIPVLGRAGPDGLYVAAGFNGHGFALSPVVGRILADLVAEGRTSIDITPFRVGRFADGTARLEQGAL